MKQPWEWTEEDLLALITNGITESVELEYKECEALGPHDNKKNELSKDVSAFANSAGGTIVYGMVENGHVPTKLDSGYDPSKVTKEWIEQVINSRIQQRIDGIRIKSVELVTTSPGKVAYVVHIPQSMRAPHQAADKKFYKRFNFQSVAMEEYEIRDVSRRLEAPDLQIQYSITRDATPVDPVANSKAIKYLLSPLITNHAPMPAEYAVIKLLIDIRIEIKQVVFSGLSMEQIEFDGEFHAVQVYNVNHSIPGKMPLIESVSFKLLEFPLPIEVPNPGLYVLGYRIFSPKMSPKLDVFRVKLPLD